MSTSGTVSVNLRTPFNLSVILAFDNWVVLQTKRANLLIVVEGNLSHRHISSFLIYASYYDYATDDHDRIITFKLSPGV